MVALAPDHRGTPPKTGLFVHWGPTEWRLTKLCWCFDRWVGRCVSCRTSKKKCISTPLGIALVVLKMP